jgi:hypothetical protein
MEEGSPIGFPLPKTMLDFRTMNIPELGIFRISSPATLNPTQTPKLQTKIEEIKDLLDAAKIHRAKKKIKKSLGETIDELRKEKKNQVLTIAGFARRYQEQESVIDDLSRKLKIANERNSLITKELSEVRGAKKTRGLRLIDPEGS